MIQLNCIIVDDEPIAVSILEEYVAKHPNLILKESFTRSTNALEYLQDNNTDLLFLDIHMPGITGLDLLADLEIKPLCVFTTAYRDYALEAFELDVIDYLKKPIRFERFQKSVEKALRILDSRTDEDQKEARDVLEFSMHRKRFRVLYHDIIYLESRRNTVHLFTIDGEYQTICSLSNIEEELPDHFVRIHRSFIVNRNFIRSFNRKELFLTSSDTSLPISRSFLESDKEL